ncbi:hypothetical protein LUZ63_003183 [Rhynchospora breviuscula]|uniref:non-specific serine/threonine protein kinase n=1 Tax=Rhynchospora breviuscula TaxID=2022672 RepID=A0A9Q0D078_9POAL|nr:hypothetical protein LUZ63_003183 [Rhynchospora breviuscula]
MEGPSPVSLFLSCFLSAVPERESPTLKFKTFQTPPPPLSLSLFSPSPPGRKLETWSGEGKEGRGVVTLRFSRNTFFSMGGGSWFSMSHLFEMGCCGCFSFLGKLAKPQYPYMVPDSSSNFGDNLLQDSMYSWDGSFYSNGGDSDFLQDTDENGLPRPTIRRSEEILQQWVKSGLICRELPVKDTHTATFSEDENGNKMVNEYVRQHRIGAGSYGKVVLYRSTKDGKLYALKVFNKPHLVKLRVAPSETAMTDVLREVSIMKMLDHPNIVNLIEVIDDCKIDKFYMVLEYVGSKWVSDDSGALSSLEESTARSYLRDIVAGLTYLHSHNIIHGDIKPDNLLVTGTGRVKIADFGVSQAFEGDNDLLRRSPGTPVFTAPECCIGVTYHGKGADTWAVGVTLYCMVLGCYPFLGEGLHDTYDKIVNNPLVVPDHINPLLRDLLERLLCKDPNQRITLQEAATHPWVVGDMGPIPDCICTCRRNSTKQDEPA